MPDFSYQSLVSALAPQMQSPTPLMDGLSNPTDQFSLAQMRAKQSAQQDPRNFMREINPGQTWGGRDRNAIQPNDVMQSYITPPPPEPI